MAKKSSIEKNGRRRKLSKKYSGRRARLKAIARDKTKPMEERFAATLKLAELPRNSSASRIRNRCEISGRPRGYYRKHRLSRIALRDLGSKGLIPGLVKSSWEGGRGDGHERSARRHDRSHSQCTNAQQVEGIDAGVQVARERAGCAQNRRLHPRLRRGRALERAQRTRDRVEIFRRRAGDP